MKKCGIITLCGMSNYGNRLQNYAVIYIVKKIGYIPINFYDAKRLSFIIRNIQSIFKKNFSAVQRFVKFKALDKKLTKNVYNMENLKNREKNCDYIILGSDQIWNPYWAGTEHFFAPSIAAQKKIAYAASFGVSEIPEHKKEIYTKYLNEMKAISVREEDGAKIVKELTGRDATVLVDPTLMLDKEEWLKIAKKPKFDVSKKYVLTYFLGEVSGRRKEYIDYVCKQNNLKLINLDAKNPNTFWYKTGPAEFLWLIDNASVMLTDSFHGSVFSVLMDTPFLVFDREDTIDEMSSRIDTLLNTLKLQDRRFNNQSGEEIFKKEYAHIPGILKTERDKAINFLKNAMELK